MYDKAARLGRLSLLQQASCSSLANKCVLCKQKNYFIWSESLRTNYLDRQVEPLEQELIYLALRQAWKLRLKCEVFTTRVMRVVTEKNHSVKSHYHAS